MKIFCSALVVIALFTALPILAADAPAKGKIVHVVAFKYKKAVTDAKQKEIADAQARLRAAQAAYQAELSKLQSK